MQELSQERVFELHSPVQPSMDLMCTWETSEMPTFSHQHPKSITLSVDQSLECKTLPKWLSCTGQSMVENQVEKTSETIFDHACDSSILLPVQLI